MKDDKELLTVRSVVILVFMPHLLIITGASGVGKSTIAESISASQEGPDGIRDREAVEGGHGIVDTSEGTVAEAAVEVLKLFE